MANITRRLRALAAGITAMLALGVGGAAAQSSVDIGLLAPFSGPWAEHGKFMRIGAEMELTIIPFRDDGETKVVTFAFKPV